MTRRTQRILVRAEACAVTRARTTASDVARINLARAPIGNRTCRLPWSGTFHSIANRLIRRHAAAVGLDASFSVLDRGDAADLMDVLRHELGFSKAEKRFPRKDTCLAIYSHRVNTQRPLADTLDTVFPWCAEWEAQLTRALPRVRREKARKPGARLRRPAALLARDDVRRSAWPPRSAREFDHILVDEYQDTNVLQAEILKALRQNGDGVTVVGDDAQAIYSFRAATVDNILGFPEQYIAGERPRRDGHHAGRELPFDAGRARCGQRVDRGRRAAVPQGPPDDDAARASAAIRHRRRRSGAGRVRRRARARNARARRAAEAPGGAVPELASQRRARAGAHAAQHSVS